MFKPWVGEHFGSPDHPLGSKRLLVLGESHHSRTHPVGSLHPTMTVDTVNHFRTAERASWMRTFDNIAAAIAGRSKPQLGRAGVNAIWDQIAFYNYVPVVAAPASRNRPSVDYFALGAEPFRTMLDALQPRAIVVCGYELWARIIPRHASDYTDNAWHPSTPFASIGERRVPALRMVHPSTAYSPSRWSPLIADLMQRPLPAEPE